MTQTAVVSARIAPDLKQSAERVFSELGLTVTQAITLFYEQVETRQTLPFSAKVPNAITQKALADARARRDLEKFDAAAQLFEDLGI